MKAGVHHSSGQTGARLLRLAALELPSAGVPFDRAEWVHDLIIKRHVFWHGSWSSDWQRPRNVLEPACLGGYMARVSREVVAACTSYLPLPLPNEVRAGLSFVCGHCLYRKKVRTTRGPMSNPILRNSDLLSVRSLLPPHSIGLKVSTFAHILPSLLLSTPRRPTDFFVVGHWDSSQSEVSRSRLASFPLRVSNASP